MSISWCLCVGSGSVLVQFWLQLVLFLPPGVQGVTPSLIHFFFGGVSLVFIGLFDSERSQDDSMLDLVLGGVLEASWSGLGAFLGGQDAPKTAQDGAKTG